MALEKDGWSKEGRARGKIIRQSPLEQDAPKHRKKSSGLSEKQIKDKIAALDKKIRKWSNWRLPDGSVKYMGGMCAWLKRDKEKLEKELERLRERKET